MSFHRSLAMVARLRRRPGHSSSIALDLSNARSSALMRYGPTMSCGMATRVPTTTTRRAPIYDSHTPPPRSADEPDIIRSTNGLRSKPFREVALTSRNPQPRQWTSDSSWIAKQKTKERELRAPIGTQVPLLLSSMDGPDDMTLAARENPSFFTPEWGRYDLGVRQRHLHKIVRDRGYPPSRLLDALIGSIEGRKTELEGLSRVDLYTLLRWHASRGEVDLSQVEVSVWGNVLKDIVKMRHAFLIKLFICDIDPSCTPWLIENNDGLSPIELMNKLRFLRKKHRAQTPVPSLSTLDLIHPLHVNGGHFGAVPNSEQRAALFNFVIRQASNPSLALPNKRQEELFPPNLVAQVMRKLIQLDKTQSGLAPDEVSMSLPRGVESLPPTYLRKLFQILIQSDETDVDLFYLVEGLRRKLTATFSPSRSSVDAFPTLKEGTDILLYYMSPAVFLRTSALERSQEKKQAFGNPQRAGPGTPETSPPLEHISSNKPVETKARSEAQARQEQEVTNEAENDDSGATLEYQRQIELVSSVLKVFSDVLQNGSVRSGVAKEVAEKALAQTGEDIDKVIPWLRNEVILKLSSRGSTSVEDGAVKAILGPTWEKMETIKFRLTVRIASLRLLLEAQDTDAASRSLFLLADDMFWMRRSLEQCRDELPPSDGQELLQSKLRPMVPDPYEEIVAPLLPALVVQIAAHPTSQAIKDLLDGLRWLPRAHVYAVTSEQVNSLVTSLAFNGFAGEAVEFLAFWTGLNARGEFASGRLSQMHDLTQMMQSDRTVVNILKAAGGRLNEPMAQTLAASFRWRTRRSPRPELFSEHALPSLPFILARMGLLRLLEKRHGRVSGLTPPLLERLASFVFGENNFVLSNPRARRESNPHTQLVHRMYRQYLRAQFNRSCVPDPDLAARTPVSTADLRCLFNTALMLQEYDDAMCCAGALRRRKKDLGSDSIALIFKVLAQSDPDETVDCLRLLLAGNGEELGHLMPGLADLLPPRISTVTMAAVVDNLFHILWGRRYYAAASNLATGAAQHQLGIKLGPHAYALLHMASQMSPQDFSLFVRQHMDKGDVQHFAGALITMSRWWGRGHELPVILEDSLAGASEWSAIFLNYPWRELAYNVGWARLLWPAISLTRSVFLKGEMIEYRNVLLLVKRIRQMADRFTDQRNRSYWSDQLWTIILALLLAHRGAPYMPIDTPVWQLPAIPKEELRRLSALAQSSAHLAKPESEPDADATYEQATPTGSAFSSLETGVENVAFPGPSSAAGMEWISYKHGKELPSLSAVQTPFVPRPISPSMRAGHGPYYRGEFVGSYRVPFVILSHAAMGFATLGDAYHLQRILDILDSYGLDARKTKNRAEEMYQHSRTRIPRWNPQVGLVEHRRKRQPDTARHPHCHARDGAEQQQTEAALP